MLKARRKESPEFTGESFGNLVRKARPFYTLRHSSRNNIQQVWSWRTVNDTNRKKVKTWSSSGDISIRNEIAKDLELTLVKD